MAKSSHRRSKDKEDIRKTEKYEKKKSKRDDTNSRSLKKTATDELILRDSKMERKSDKSHKSSKNKRRKDSYSDDDYADRRTSKIDKKDTDNDKKNSKSERKRKQNDSCDSEKEFEDKTKRRKHVSPDEKRDKKHHNEKNKNYGKTETEYKNSSYEDSHKIKSDRKYKQNNAGKEDRRAGRESDNRSRRDDRDEAERSPTKHVKETSQERNAKKEKNSTKPSEDGKDTIEEESLKDGSAAKKRTNDDSIMTKTGGAYIPPAKLRMMQDKITDKSSIAYQRIAWEALKKSIHGLINKVNVSNVALIVRQMLKENVIRGRGLLCKSIMQAQAVSPTYTAVYAALVAIINTKFPSTGQLLVGRCVQQFKRSYKRNDKPLCIATVTFIAHLMNQAVVHEILPLQILILLIENATDDSMEVAIALLKEAGQRLQELSSQGLNAIFDMLRNILHEGKLDKRVQYMIEVMFQVRKDNFKDYPSVAEDLELIEEEDQFTHMIVLDEEYKTEDMLNVFKYDPDYEMNELKYKALYREILGSDDEAGSDDSSSDGGDEEEEEDEDEEEAEAEEKKMIIRDETETNLMAFRRTVYLTINSSLDYEECAHKLLKMQIKPGMEMELCHMFLDCCTQQRTYEKFFGLLAQRFCQLNRLYAEQFEQIFKDSYSTVHRLDTNRLRNVAKFFAHLLFTDAISWSVLQTIRLNEEDTTSSGRVFIKIMFQELCEYMGMGKLRERVLDVEQRPFFEGLFPKDNPKNTRFSINFFTLIGLGGLTDDLRDHLNPKRPSPPPEVTHVPPAAKMALKIMSPPSTSSSSSSSSSTSSSSSSPSPSPPRRRRHRRRS